MISRVASTASIACFFVRPFSATNEAISALVTHPPSFPRAWSDRQVRRSSGTRRQVSVANDQEIEALALEVLPSLHGGGSGVKPSVPHLEHDRVGRLGGDLWG